MGPRSTLSVPPGGLAGFDANPQVFYVLSETPCPYLSGRLERKLITELAGADPDELYSRLSRSGFRRSHGYAYRPACNGCAACVPVRVLVQEFEPSRSLKRIWRRNQDLAASEETAQATDEQYQLFDLYLRARHSDGEMAGMAFQHYRSMVEATYLDTRLTEFRNTDGQLIAACLADWLKDGASAVYSFFDPAESDRGLGSYVVLWLIEEARRRSRRYLYLGYWIEGSRKMAYKARFRPIEGLGPDGWRPLPPNPPEGR